MIIERLEKLHIRKKRTKFLILYFLSRLLFRMILLFKLKNMTKMSKITVSLLFIQLICLNSSWFKVRSCILMKLLYCIMFDVDIKKMLFMYEKSFLIHSFEYIFYFRLTLQIFLLLSIHIKNYAIFIVLKQ